MAEAAHISQKSNLVNRRQRSTLEAPGNFYSTANQWFNRGLKLPEVTITNSPDSSAETVSHIQQPSTSQHLTSTVRFFDASSISTTKSNKKDVKERAINIEDTSQLNDVPDIPRIKAVVLHKVLSSDTFAGISLKYGVEVGILRRVNKLWSGDPLQFRDRIKIPLEHCTITDAELSSLNARVVSQEELDSMEALRKSTEGRSNIDSYSPRSSSSWSSSSSVLEDSREILEPLASLVSRAVDSISKPLKQSHAWTTVNNNTFRRSKKDFIIPDREEGPWIQMQPTDKSHTS
ncbi:hypothetical protein K7432_001047 [Basidiobolus ranarum]|uniref:LysM domain-containing protein n=1 Tax=Basidiobolus ranarum TaxID=34480 RepID=A0ABR2X3P4_9FUNG